MIDLECRTLTRPSGMIVGDHPAASKYHLTPTASVPPTRTKV
jgi:hypothetical protein